MTSLFSNFKFISLFLIFSFLFYDISFFHKDNTLLNKEKKLTNIISEKNLSILGDSISTFPGFSNNYKDTNSSIKNNAVYYTGKNAGINTVEQTWWKKISKKYNLNILVNNSWSGSKVSNNTVGTNNAGYIRANQLHDNTGENSGTLPDIIAIYLGINDFNSGIELGTFDKEKITSIINNNSKPNNFNEAYIIMINNIINSYPNAEIYCFTLLPNGKNTNYKLLEEYNDNIRNIADYFEINIVDLYKNSGINSSNYLNYSDEDNGLHPNESGMNVIAKTFEKALIDNYT